MTSPQQPQPYVPVPQPQQPNAAVPQPQPYASASQQYYPPAAQQPQPMAPVPVPAGAALRTKRGLLKFVLLGLIAFGIYDIWQMSEVGETLNLIATRRDGKRTMHYCLMFFIVGWLTFGIGWLVWNHRLSARIGTEQGPAFAGDRDGRDILAMERSRHVDHRRAVGLHIQDPACHE